MRELTPKRIAYLCFHVAGRDVELPVLRRLGFEIFSIKKYGKDHRSGAHDFEDDAGLTIPKAVVDYLNSVNFVDAQEWPDLAIHYLNLYFDYIFIIQNQHVVYNAIRSFNGHVIVRLAGLDAPKTYTNYWSLHQRDLLPAVYRNRHRVWMSTQYRNLTEVEDPIFAERSVFMPLGIPSFFKKVIDTWHGNGTGHGPNVISVLPWIDTPYYAHKLQRATDILGNRPLRVLGAQRVKTTDPRIVGFLTNDEYLAEFQGARALFYDSLEPRHVHYPPIEAAAIGLPLVFFRNSLLGSLGLEPLAGACDNVDEVRAKLDRILAGDATFIGDVRSSQKTILREFQDDFVYECWQAAFTRMQQEGAAHRSAPSVGAAAPLPVGDNHLRNGTIELLPIKTEAGTLSTPQMALDRAKLSSILAVLNWTGPVTPGGSSAEAVIDGTPSRGVLVAQTIDAAGGSAVACDQQCWAFSDRMLLPTGGSSELQLKFRPAPDLDNGSVTMLRVATGAFRKNKAASFDKRNRAGQPALTINFSQSNPYGLDVTGPNAKMLFLCQEDTQDLPTKLRLRCDRHDHKERFEIVVVLNQVELARMAADKFRGSMDVDLQGALKRFNQLEFKIVWLDPCPDAEGRITAHISSLELI